MFRIFTYGLVVLIIPLSILAGIGGDKEGGIGKVEVDREGYKPKNKPYKTSFKASKAKNLVLSGDAGNLAGGKKFKGADATEPDKITPNNEYSSKKIFIKKSPTKSYSAIVSKETDKIIEDKKLQCAEPMDPHKIAPKKETNPSKRYREEIHKNPYPEKETAKAATFSNVNGRESTASNLLGKVSVKDKPAIKNDKISLKEFKNKYFEEKEKYNMGCPKKPEFIIPATKSNKTSIEAFFEKDNSAYSKLLRYAAIQFVIKYQSGFMIERLFRYSGFGSAYCRTFLNLGDNEEESYFLVQATLSNKQPLKYLLLALNGGFELIEKENDNSSRFGRINSKKAEQINQRIMDAEKNGVPKWLDELIPEFLSETYYKRKKSPIQKSSTASSK